VTACAAAELVVVLDDLVARPLGPVGIDAERGDAERAPERLPLELSEARKGVDFVEPDDGEELAQRFEN
jgi:hypothetical protein